MLKYLGTSDIHQRIYELQKKINKLYDRVFILPTRFGVYFITIIFILFLMSLSYGHSLAISATFLFVSIVMISIIYTNYNLYGVVLKEQRSKKPFFNHDDFQISLFNEWGRPRPDIELEVSLQSLHDKKNLTYIGATSLLGRMDSSVNLKPLTSSKGRRGVYQIERIKVSSSFPFGLFRSWKFLRPLSEQSRLYIFPNPLEPKVEEELVYSLRNKLMDQVDHSKQIKRLVTRSGIGTENFYEHSPYRDSGGIKRIDWKIYSRTHELFEKHYEDEHKQRSRYLLDRRNFQSYPLELQMSYLCFYILKYTREAKCFALVLNDETPHWDSGKKHEQSCLIKLSEFRG